MNRRLLSTAVSAAAALAIAGLTATAAHSQTPAQPKAQSKGEVKIALISSKSGPLEAFSKQTITGFNLGLDYATGGTLMVAGKKLVVIEKDDQGKPDVGKALLAAAYAGDAVGPTAMSTLSSA